MNIDISGASSNSLLMVKDVDRQGNPIDSNGNLILEDVGTIYEISDEDFLNPKRSIRIPQIPKIIRDTIGIGEKSVIIKKNVFEKNSSKHTDLTPQKSREILNDVFYNTDLYGQNQKVSHPYNWILIHLADPNSAVVVEVNENKDNAEIINWHYISNDALERKRKQAIREGGAYPHVKLRSCRYF